MTEHVAELVAAAPPVAVSTAITVLGMELDTWIKLATLAYTFILILRILIVSSWKRDKEKD